MKPLSEFHSRITPHITGVPEPTLNAALVDAAVRFCETTKAIHQRQSLALVVGRAGYEVEAPQAQRVVVVEKVWYQQYPLTALHTPEIPGPSERTGRPTHFYGQRTENGWELSLYPTPDEAVNLTLEVAYSPTRTAGQLEDDLLDLWLESIRSATLSYLFSLPGQVFTDLQQAAYHATMAMRHFSEARRRVLSNRVVGSLSAKPRAFA